MSLNLDCKEIEIMQSTITVILEHHVTTGHFSNNQDILSLKTQLGLCGL